MSFKYIVLCRPFALCHHRYSHLPFSNRRRCRAFVVVVSVGFLLKAWSWSSVVLRTQCVLCFIASSRCTRRCYRICRHLGDAEFLRPSFMHGRHQNGLSAQNVSAPPLALTFQVIEGASFGFLGKGYNDGCLLNIVSSSQVRERNEALMKKDILLSCVPPAPVRDGTVCKVPSICSHGRPRMYM